MINILCILSSLPGIARDVAAPIASIRASRALFPASWTSLQTRSPPPRKRDFTQCQLTYSKQPSDPLVGSPSPFCSSSSLPRPSKTCPKLPAHSEQLKSHRVYKPQKQQYQEKIPAQLASTQE